VYAGHRTAGWGLPDDAGILADRSAGAVLLKYFPFLLCARTHCQKYSLLRDTRGSRVANIKSQMKRIKTNEKARQRNVAVKSALKTAVRRVRTAAESGDAAAAATALATASKALDKAASKGVIHKNQAANRTSGLAKQVAGL